MDVRLEHIGIAVESLDDATAAYETLLSIEQGRVCRKEDKEQKVRIAFIELPNCRIELLEPTSPDSPIAKFLESRGEGIHHLCFVAPRDLEEECKRLEAASFRIVSSEKDKCFFVHPKDCKGSLIEFYGENHA